MISNIVMMSRPTYPYMKHLHLAFFHMRDYAEDFDNDFTMGRAFWLREIREERDAPSLAEIIEEDGDCCYKSFCGGACSCSNCDYY